MPKEIKNVNGAIYERDENGRWSILVPNCEGSERVYWCVVNEQDEIVCLHEGLKGALTTEMLMAGFPEQDGELRCYELDAIEYDALYEGVQAKAKTGEWHKDAKIQERIVKAALKKGAYSEFDFLERKMKPKALRHPDEIVNERLRKKHTEEN